MRPCVLLANEPRAYREVLAAALGDLRPDIDFVVLEPIKLDRVVRQMHPTVVICDEATPVVCDHSEVWLELYPDQGSRSVLGFRSERSLIEDVQLSDIITIIDQAVAYEAR